MFNSEIIQQWIVRIIGHEGGYWNDPVGGPTKWGISQRSYPKLDIASLTVQDAEAIYKRDYLAPLKVDLFEDGVAYQLLDFAINSGQRSAIKCLQKELGLLSDGIIGPQTLSALIQKSESDLIKLIIASRITYMVGLKNWKANCTGWMLRIAANLRYGAIDTD